MIRASFTFPILGSLFLLIFVAQGAVQDQNLTQSNKLTVEPNESGFVSPFVEASAGFLISGRAFEFKELEDPRFSCSNFAGSSLNINDPTKRVYRYDPNRCSRFDPSITGGLRLQVAGYPFARHRHHALQGLGLSALVDWVIWPDSSYAYRGQAPISLETREVRFEGGLYYRYNFLANPRLPSLLASLQYGFHWFALQKQEKYYDVGSGPPILGVDDHGFPEVRYQYITFGLGTQIPYYVRKNLSLRFVLMTNLHAVFHYGEMQKTFHDTSSEEGRFQGGGYGPANGYGFRVAVTPIEIVAWKGLTFRLAGFYEFFQTFFQLGQSLPASTRSEEQAAFHLAHSAMDHYFGGMVMVGYQY